MNIFKHKLNYGINHLRLPRATQFLNTMLQDGIIYIYTLETDESYTGREIVVCFTGEDVDIRSYDIYLGTVKHEDLVYHIFEKL